MIIIYLCVCVCACAIRPHNYISYIVATHNATGSAGVRLAYGDAWAAHDPIPAAALGDLAMHA